MQIEINECIAFVRLDCSGRNAFSRKVSEDLRDAFEHIAHDVSLRCMILTCEGSEDLITENAETHSVSEQAQRVFDSIVSCPVPVIAALNGVIAGVAVELSLACHLRIASNETELSLTDFSKQKLFARIVGESHAKQITNKKIKADEALRIGLINRVVEKSKLLEEATLLAQTISQLAPLAVRACLQAVTKGIDLPLQEGLQLEAKLFSELFATEDAREGTRAFLEKRQPVFTGK